MLRLNHRCEANLVDAVKDFEEARSLASGWADVYYNPEIVYEILGSINSVYVKTFFDAKHGELIDYLRDYPDPELFSKLKKIDPPHSSKYDAVMP